MRRRTLLVAVSALALATAGCGGGTASGRTQLADDATFSAAIPADPGKLDPGTAVLSVTNTTLSFAYDTLVYQDPSGKVISGLADSWTTTPTSVTFTLHKGVTCSDGSPLTASQVAQNFTWVTDPKNKSPLLGVFIPADTKATADDAAGTVTVTTDKPYGFLLVSTASVWIACGKALADRSVLATGTSGTGPYKLTEAVPSDHYTFTVRPGYAWGPGGATTKAKGIPAKKVAGRAQHGNATMLLDKLHAARLSGVDARGDLYPYLAGASFLGAVLPGAAHAGGPDRLRARLTDPAERAALRALAEDTSVTVNGGFWRHVEPGDILVTKHATRPGAVGRTLARTANGADAWTTLCDLLAEDPGASMVITMMAEDDMRAIMRDPLIGVGSDNGLPTEFGHPRTWGCFPRVLGEYVRELGVLSMPAAIRKMTSAIADQFGLAGRGFLGPGAVADVAVFDPATIGHAGTYAAPDVPPTGVRYVLLAGAVVIDGGDFTRERRGRVLRG